MNLQQRLKLLTLLGDEIRQRITEWDDVLIKAQAKNPWFSIDNSKSMLQTVAEDYLDEGKLSQWVTTYPISAETPKLTIGLVLAGNIPMVGWHDVMSVFVAGHKAQVKYSSKDDVLIPHLLDLMIKIDPAAAAYFEKVERVLDTDAVIVTGSNNSTALLEQYFKSIPSLIRRNRTSVAYVSADSTDEYIMALADDVYAYFGLGCRNVSFIAVDNEETIIRILTLWDDRIEIMYHNKFKNNFDYSYALYLLNKSDFKSNGNLIMLNSNSIHARIACVNYQYMSKEAFHIMVEENRDQLQVVIAAGSNEAGSAQRPQLQDYADNIDTLKFLSELV